MATDHDRIPGGPGRNDVDGYPGQLLDAREVLARAALGLRLLGHVGGIADARIVEPYVKDPDAAVARAAANALAKATIKPTPRTKSR